MARSKDSSESVRYCASMKSGVSLLFSRQFLFMSDSSSLRKSVIVGAVDWSDVCMMSPNNSPKPTASVPAGFGTWL